GSVMIGSSGAARTVTVTPMAGQSGTATVTLTVTDGGNLTASDTFVVNVAQPVVPPITVPPVTVPPVTVPPVTVPPVTVSPPPVTVPPPPGIRPHGFATGGAGTVTMYDPDGAVRFTTQPFPGFTGAIRTATADFNGDGVDDVVVGT